MFIKEYKWEKNDFKILKKSCQTLLNIKELQIYQPYFSLYFHIHNTKHSHNIFDLKRRYYVKEILSSYNEKIYTSNIFAKCKIYDSMKNIHETKDLFCKCIPLLDPIHLLMDNYSNNTKRNSLLPSLYNHNTFQKINNMNNTAYIDTFFSFICSHLTLSDINPSFPIYYGSFNGIKKEFNYDITDDYCEFKHEKWFYKNCGKTYTLDMYLSDSNSDSDSDSDSDASFSSYGSNDNGEYIVSLKNIPCQNLLIEKLDGTLEDFLEDVDNIQYHIIISCLFQVSFALCYLQKNFKFTHNDLHINNIMYKKTDRIYLYYKFNNIYFKVPTHGYLFQIIDFGRSIFTFHNKYFFNDTFEKHGEAEGQYSLIFNNLLFNKNMNDIIYPNYNFDLCRLAITILDTINFNKQIDYKEYQYFYDFLYNLTKNIDGNYLYGENDDFNMYINIAKYANNALPLMIIQNEIFNQFRIKKKKFPKKSYYSL